MNVSIHSCSSSSSLRLLSFFLMGRFRAVIVPLFVNTLFSLLILFSLSLFLSFSLSLFLSLSLYLSLSRSIITSRIDFAHGKVRQQRLACMCEGDYLMSPAKTKKKGSLSHSLRRHDQHDISLPMYIPLCRA